MSLTFAATQPALAIGGNDPIEGIDIIIKRNPGSRPIKPISLGDKQLAMLSEMRSKEGAQFLGEIILKHLGPGGGAGKADVRDLTLARDLEKYTGADKLPESYKFNFSIPGSETNYDVLIKTKQ